MAIGQLADYGRHVEGAAPTVLLPDRPALDLIDLLHELGIRLLVREGKGFVLVAPGASKSHA